MLKRGCAIRNEKSGGRTKNVEEVEMLQKVPSKSGEEKASQRCTRARRYLLSRNSNIEEASQT